MYNVSEKVKSMLLCCKRNWVMVLVIGLIIAAVMYFILVNVNEGFDNVSNAEGPALVPESDEIVAALFYADWCPHCVEFKPKFEAVANRLNGKTCKSKKRLRLEKVDCVKYGDLAETYNVRGFPTVKLIRADGDAVEYEGPREVEDFNKFLMDL
jgi:protein disulfide-isomerase A1